MHSWTVKKERNKFLDSLVLTTLVYYFNYINSLEECSIGQSAGDFQLDAASL